MARVRWRKGRRRGRRGRRQASPADGRHSLGHSVDPSRPDRRQGRRRWQRRPARSRWKPRLRLPRQPRRLGRHLRPATPCTKPQSCQPISAGGLCTVPNCTADGDCKFGQASAGKCTTVVASGLIGTKTCFPPCGATMVCTRPDFTCDLAKGACVPDCRTQADGFCPSFTTCDLKSGLFVGVPCASGTCPPGQVCWADGCANQVCTPDCTAQVSAPCKLDIDCPSGVCTAGQCVACLSGAKCQTLSKVCSQVGVPACQP